MPASKTAKAAAKKSATPSTLKKGATITFSTGSRWGKKEYSGTVYAFVPMNAAPKAPKGTVVSKGDPNKPSNRDRYIVKIGDGFRFANASSIA
jgi:co-chaperonin GroES (HSP10)